MLEVVTEHHDESLRSQFFRQVSQFIRYMNGRSLLGDVIQAERQREYPLRIKARHFLQ